MKSILSLMACVLVAGTASARDLDVAADDVTKQEIRHGQIGPRDTVIFHTFGEQDAVLQLNIKHEAGKFSVSGKMQLFKQGTGSKEIAKWINNQHSCGLFPDVPKPATVPLPADACMVLESELKRGGQLPVSPVTGSKFQDYTLKIQVSELKMEGFRLKAFTLDTGAYVKVGPSA